MPNTVTVPYLRERYTITFGHGCDLTYSQVWKLWMTTAHGRKRGKHVPLAVLEERVVATVQLMHKNWDNISARATPTCPMCGKSMRESESTQQQD